MAPPRLIETVGPEPDTPEAEVRLAVGVITGVHGVRGELRLRLMTDDPEHLATVKRVYVGDAEERRRLVSFRFHGREALIRISGVETTEQARGLRGQIVRISAGDARPLEPGEFRLYQLIGLTAYDEFGSQIGTVIDLMETGANDVVVIEPVGGGDALLLPFHPESVIEVEPTARRMIVRLPKYYGE